MRRTESTHNRNLLICKVPKNRIENRKMMKNKKGFLLGEYTLKVVIAVLCLLLLVYLLFRIYSNSQDERNLRMAEATLDELEEKMDEAKEKGESEVSILNPTKDSLLGELWAIIGWPYESYKEKPEQCGENCICICMIPRTYETEPFGKIADDLLEECNSLGTCKDFDSKIKILNPGWFEFDGLIPIKNPPVNLNISFKDNQFIISKK